MSRWEWLRGRTPTAVWLLLVWLLLWWEWDLATLLFGIAASAGVVALFPMPPIRPGLALRPLPLAALLAFVLGDVALSAIRLARDAVWRPAERQAAIVAVDMLSDADHVVAVSADLLTLSPGTFVVEIDRDHHRYFVYSLSIGSPADVDKVRRRTLRMQTLVTRSFGPVDEGRAPARRGAGR